MMMRKKGKNSSSSTSPCFIKKSSFYYFILSIFYYIWGRKKTIQVLIFPVKAKGYHACHSKWCFKKGKSSREKQVDGIFFHSRLEADINDKTFFHPRLDTILPFYAFLWNQECLFGELALFCIGYFFIF